MSPHLGPRNVLCVVVVTTSKNFHGPSITPPAISPEICAISAIRIGLYPCFFSTLLAISPNFFRSIVHEYAENPAIIIAGLCSSALSSISL